MMTDPLPDDMSPDELLAMELALGLLSGADRAAAEARRATDAGFAAQVGEWEQRLLPLSDTLPAEPPPPVLWQRIEAAVAAEARLAPEAPPAAARAPSWWDRLPLWRGATAAFAALSLALLVTRPSPEARAPVPAPASGTLLAATLASEGGAPLVTAALDPERRAVVIAPVDRPALDGRVPELWLIPPDGRPRSLGLIDLGGTRRIKVPATVLRLVAEGAVLAVSLEPAGGSPTGLPTGPVVATGKLSPV